jgi:hypothetical protein
MIETLIIILIILLAFGFVIWAVANYFPYGQHGIIIVILALIALLVVLHQLGVVTV